MERIDVWIFLKKLSIRGIPPIGCSVVAVMGAPEGAGHIGEDSGVEQDHTVVWSSIPETGHMARHNIHQGPMAPQAKSELAPALPSITLI